jgi:hypothetical protein
VAQAKVAQKDGMIKGSQIAHEQLIEKAKKGGDLNAMV